MVAAVVGVGADGTGRRLRKNRDFCTSALPLLVVVEGVSADGLVDLNLEKLLLVNNALLSTSLLVVGLNLLNCLVLDSNVLSVDVLTNLLPAVLVFSVLLLTGLANRFTYLFGRNFFSVVVSSCLSVVVSLVFSVVVVFSRTPIVFRRVGRKCTGPPNRPFSIDFWVGSSTAIMFSTVVDDVVVACEIGWVTGSVFLCSSKKF